MISSVRFCSFFVTARRTDDLCVFRQELDRKKALIGRVVQFSYMEGSKRTREYSSTYVDMNSYTDNDREERNDIGAFANWFARQDLLCTDLVFIKPLELVFHAGFLSMKNYIATIDDSAVRCQPDGGLAIKAVSLSSTVPNWRDIISLHDDFSDLQDCAVNAWLSVYLFWIYRLFNYSYILKNFRLSVKRFSSFCMK